MRGFSPWDKGGPAEACRRYVASSPGTGFQANTLQVSRKLLCELAPGVWTLLQRLP